jgi:lipoprotein LprG
VAGAIVAGTLVAAAFATCSSSAPKKEPLPAAGPLLAGAASRMAAVRTVHFGLDAAGPPGPQGIRRVDGVLTKERDAEGTLELLQAGNLIEYQVIISGGTYYVKGPTGGYQAIPGFLASSFYDPTTLLSPQTGVANVLRTAKGPVTQAEESVGGTAAYRVHAMIATDLLRPLLPPGPEPFLPADLWIAKAKPELLQVRMRLEIAGQAEPSVMTLTLSDLDAPITIAPPTG